VKEVLTGKIVLGNSVPAAAVIQRGQTLSMLTGRKECVGGHYVESVKVMIAS